MTGQTEKWLVITGSLPLFAAQLKLPQQKMSTVNVIRTSYLTLRRPV